jgi:glycine hydroxymethyltransferase
MPLLPWTEWLTAPMARLDPDMDALIAAQRAQNAATVNLVASETYSPRAALEAEASAMVDKNASGYPPRRGFGGGGVMDDIERLACARACALFGAEHANIQALSSTIANIAVLRGLLRPGDRILAFDPLAGGHVSHGAGKHISGHAHEVRFFGVDARDAVDYAAAARIAAEFRPRMIIAGSTSYPWPLDFRRLAAIAAEVGALFFADVAHVAGLIAAGLHDNPVPYADVVTTSTHKTLCGPRTGGLILCKARHAPAIDQALAPGLQAAPGGHIVAARAVLFRLVAQPEFRLLMAAVLQGAAALAEGLLASGVALYAGGTGTHMVVVDLRGTAWRDADLTERLFRHGMITNTTSLTGGLALRLGSTPMALRGVDAAGMRAVGLRLGAFLARGPEAPDDPQLAEAMAAMARRHPVPPGLEVA